MSMAPGGQVSGDALREGRAFGLAPGEGKDIAAHETVACADLGADLHLGGLGKEPLAGIGKDVVTPDELINALLKAEADLLWFGGIGTYVKARSESNSEVGDRANDEVLDIFAAVARDQREDVSRRDDVVHAL